jgi:RNA recognition motif-containing protein
VASTTGDTGPIGRQQKPVPATVATVPAALESATSPLQGFRTLVSNLHPDVTLDDIMELFSDVGPLKNARLVKPGVADVVFVNQHDAINAHKNYNMRELDGQPMLVELMFPPPPPTQLIKLSKPTVDLSVDILQRALFTSVADAKPRVPVNFTVQL